MPALKNKILLLLIIICSFHLPVFAQGCFDDVSEDELLNYYDEVKRLQNKAGDDNMDSLNAANTMLSNYLVYHGERYQVIMNDASRFTTKGMDFSVSDDNKCNLFSWEVYSYPGMHQRCGVLFYKIGDQIHSVKYTNNVAPYKITTVHTPSKNVYLLHFEDDFSLNGRGKFITANAIEYRGSQETFASEPFFSSSKGVFPFLEYRYDIPSYSVQKSPPPITISQDKKRIMLPTVDKSGNFSGQYSTYIFDGNKFVLQEPTVKK